MRSQIATHQLLTLCVSATLLGACTTDSSSSGDGESSTGASETSTSSGATKGSGAAETSGTADETSGTAETAADTTGNAETTGADLDTGSEGGNETEESSSSTGITTECTTFIPGEFLMRRASEFWFEPEPALIGDPNIADRLWLRFYSDETGTFELTNEVNSSWYTCEQCLYIEEDWESDGDNFHASFYPVSGTLTTLGEGTPWDGPYVQFSLEGVEFVEVEIDPETGVPTPIEDGRCIVIPDGEFASVQPPEGWTCNPRFYDEGDKGVSEGSCDCGCGIPDPDCSGNTGLDTCDYCSMWFGCDTLGTACSEASLIDPEDLTSCITDVPATWTCAPELYGDGECHCGCGAIDSFDCQSDGWLWCDVCDAEGSCSPDGSCDPIIIPNSSCE